MEEEKEKEVQKEPIGGTRRLEEDDYHEDFQMKNGGFIPRGLDKKQKEDENGIGEEILEKGRGKGSSFMNNL